VQTRSATYVLPFSEQNGKMGWPVDEGAGSQELRAARYPLKSSPNFGQMTGGKRALGADQLPVTHHTATLSPIPK
jgi:hypothetical protein